MRVHGEHGRSWPNKQSKMREMFYITIMVILSHCIDNVKITETKMHSHHVFEMGESMIKKLQKNRDDLSEKKKSVEPCISP